MDENRKELAESQEPIDFFVSYTSQDVAWAEWIAVQLEQAGFPCVLHAWDFWPGQNLLVLSPAYLRDGLAQAQWAAALASDPASALLRLLLVRIETCPLQGQLAPLIQLDLFGLDETQAGSSGCLEEVVEQPKVFPRWSATALPISLQGVPLVHCAARAFF